MKMAVLKRAKIVPRLLILILGVVFCLFLSDCAEKTEKVYRVGILSGLDYFADITEGFKQKMTELGYIEGKNIIYDVQKAPAPVGNETIIKKFIEDKVDLIFVFPTEATFETKTLTKGTRIPVVFGAALIEMPGLIESVRHPGEYITGVQYGGNDIAVKRLELLCEIFPQRKKIWIPFLKDYPTVPPNLEALAVAAKYLNITLLPGPFASVDELKVYLASRDASGKIEMDAILEIVEPIGSLPESNEAIYAFAKKHRLPIVGRMLTQDDSGPVLAYVPDNKDMGRLAAPLADKIFKGTPAGSIPVVSPEVNIFINYKVINDLGLNVSEGLLIRAKEIVH
jgi:putative ABC transport system substrate-binding protein